MSSTIENLEKHLAAIAATAHPDKNQLVRAIQNRIAEEYLRKNYSTQYSKTEEQEIHLPTLEEKLKRCTFEEISSMIDELSKRGLSLPDVLLSAYTEKQSKKSVDELWRLLGLVQQ